MTAQENPARYPLPEWDAGSHGHQITQLTPRGFAVLSWISAGKNNVEIAAILGISRKTIEREVTTVLTTLEVENRYAATSLFHTWRYAAKKTNQPDD